MKSAKSFRAIEIFIIMAFLAVSFIVIIVVGFDENPAQGYRLLWLLPLSFCLAIGLSIGVIRNIMSNLGVAILVVGYFIRYVITPFLLALGNYRIVFIHLVTGDHIENAIYLMLYEILVVFLFMGLYSQAVSNRIARETIDSANNSGDKGVHLLLLLCVIFCICLLVIVPEVLNSFTWIFSSSDQIAKIRYEIFDVVPRGTIKRVAVSLFIFGFNIIRYFIPVYLLRVFNKKHSWIRYWASFVICFLPFLAINESNVQPFIGLIINVVMMTELYPGRKKHILTVVSLAGLTLLSLVLVAKILLLASWQKTSGIASVALAFNAYFPGVGNVAAMENVPEVPKWNMLLGDLFATIPFRNSLFPSYAQNSITLTQMYNLANGTRGSIVPCISGSKYYLGNALAPVVPAFVSCLAIKVSRKAKQETSYWMIFYYVLLTVRIALIPTCYNHISIVHIMINQIIPTYAIIRLGYRLKTLDTYGMKSSQVIG